MSSAESSRPNNVELSTDRKESNASIQKEAASSPSAMLRANSKTENPYHYDYAPCYRWAILLFYVFLAIIVGPFFFNWPPFRDSLDRENAFAHLCEGSTTYQKLPTGVIQCDEKKQAIGAVLPISMATMFGFDLFAGVLLDLFGGKICVMFGIASQILGWIILGLSTPKFNGYLTGTCFIAAGADPCFFGLLSISNLFPGWESTVVAVLGAARSISYVNFLIVDVVLRSHPNVTLVKVAIGFIVLILICAIMGFLFIPYQSYPKLPAGVPLYTELKSEDKMKYSQYLNEAPSSDLASIKSKLVTQFGGLLQYIMTVPFLLFCLLPWIALIRNNYYSLSYEEQLSNVKTLYAILNPLSFIPCPVIGVITDRFSTVMTMIGLAVLAAVSMALVMFQGIAFEYLSLFINFFFISFCISQFYCYIAYVYPQNVMGKLIGISLLVGGLGSIVAAPMYNFGLAKKQFLSMNLTVVLMELLAICICVFLYFTMERPVKQKNAANLKIQEESLKPEIETGAEERTAPV